MAKKRGARVAPPPRDGEWALFFYDAEAADGWEDLCKQVRGVAVCRFEVQLRHVTCARFAVKCQYDE